MRSIVTYAEPAVKHSISIVVPVYNSEESLQELAERLMKVLPEISSEYEIILVNDGSKDNSWAKIIELAANHPRIHGIHLMRNSGQHNALLCGIRAAKYEVIVTLDDDLQNPPEEISKLLCKLEEGFDVVYGNPHNDPHEFWRRTSSRVIKRVMAYVMGIPAVIDISPFRAFRTELRQSFDQYRSPGVIIDVLLSWGTTHFGNVEVEEHERKHGRSNYTLGKLASAALLVLTGYSTAPLRFASMLGFSITLFGVVVLFYVVIRYLAEGSLPGFPFLASIITIFSGAQLFTLGIFGEYLAAIFNRNMEKKPYTIKSKTE